MIAGGFATGSAYGIPKLANSLLLTLPELRLCVWSPSPVLDYPAGVAKM